MNDEIFASQAKLVKALANPVRLEIIHLLRHHVLTVGQIAEMSGNDQSLVSQHLKQLKLAHTIASKREGKEVYYTIQDQRILVACDAIRSLVTDEALPNSPEPSVIDPVCGMDLTPSTATYNTTYNGVRHYFCAKGCYQKFLTNSAHYVR